MFFGFNNSTMEVGMRHLLRLVAATIMSALALQAGGLTSLTPDNPPVPSSIQLDQNYPNPFNPTTRIEYAILRESHVTLRVYSILGQEVATIVNQTQRPAKYLATLDASKLASGVYMYRLSAGSFTMTKKMLLVR